MNITEFIKLNKIKPNYVTFNGDDYTEVYNLSSSLRQYKLTIEIYNNTFNDNREEIILKYVAILIEASLVKSVSSLNHKTSWGLLKEVVYICCDYNVPLYLSIHSSYNKNLIEDIEAILSKRGYYLVRFNRIYLIKRKDIYISDL